MPAYQGIEALLGWLRTSDAYDVLDDAVMGCLLDSVVVELCEDYGVTRSEFRYALNLVLAEGY